MDGTRSFQIVDRSYSSRKEVYVSSLNELIRHGKRKKSYPTYYFHFIEELNTRICHEAQEKFDLTGDTKIVLESDGTIVDDEDYFATLEPRTCLMILKSDESWIIPLDHFSARDEVDHLKPDLSHLLKRLKNDTNQLVMLNDEDLELLSGFNPDVVGDNIQDKNFLRNIQEACNLYLNDRRDAKDYLQLMKMYHEVIQRSNIGESSDFSSTYENIN